MRNTTRAAAIAMWRYECRVSGGLRTVPERDSAHSLVHQQAGTLWGVCGWTQAVSHKHAGVMWSCFKQIWLISPQHSLWLNLVFFGIIMIRKGWKLRQEKRGRNMLCSGLFKLGLNNCDWKMQYNYHLRSGSLCPLSPLLAESARTSNYVQVQGKKVSQIIRKSIPTLCRRSAQWFYSIFTTFRP